MLHGLRVDVRDVQAHAVGDKGLSDGQTDSAG
jgi:hypothetical protein